MFIKQKFIILLLISSAFTYLPEAEGKSVLIRFNGNRSVVEINDILERERDKLSGEDLKRICAEITDRYHERGYTAFYIKRAVLNQDGTADLFFNEAGVSDVIVTGVTSRMDEVKASIYKKGELFNEFILKENISETKKKFNIKQLNVSISRGVDDQIVLTAHAVEKINEIETVIFNSPIYGVLPGLKYKVNYGGFIAGLSMSSSFNQDDRSYSSGSVYFNSDNVPGNSYFILSADAADRKDSRGTDSESVYRHKSLTSKAGFCFNKGASGIKLFLTGTADELNDYPGYNEGISFSGFQLKLEYDNSLYMIDYSDVTSFEIDFSTGWNFIEDRPSSKNVLNYIYNIPVYAGFFFSLNGNCFYTSDEERFSHIYVYDQLFPCRENDFSSASLRIVTGVDLAYEVMKRTVFIFPGFKWGLHNAGEEIDEVYAAGIKSLFTAGSVKIEMSYFYDLDLNIRDGFLMFSAAAVY